MLAPAAALLFSAAEPHELAETQLCRCLRQRRRAHQTMFHAREFPFAGSRISLEEIISDDQCQNGIAQEFERFVMKITRFSSLPRRHLLVRPRAMGHRLNEQRAIAEGVTQNWL